MNPRLLVIQPDPKGLLDNFDRWLTDAGITIHTIRPYAGDSVPGTLTGYTAVLVLGGSMSSLDDQIHPWLNDIRELLLSAHRRQQPALGICLGAQLMAQAHGGRVAVGREGTEGGLITVLRRDAAGDDALFGGLPDTFAVGALHSDAIEELPPTAQWLARSDQYPHQAFRVGLRSWGVQFHPEVNVASMHHWLACMDDEEDRDISQLRSNAEAFERQQAAVVKQTATLAKRFAAQVSASMANNIDD